MYLKHTQSKNENILSANAFTYSLQINDTLFFLSEEITALKK